MSAKIKINRISNHVILYERMDIKWKLLDDLFLQNNTWDSIIVVRHSTAGQRYQYTSIPVYIYIYYE